MTNQEIFAERLSRINKGGANTMGQVYVGPADDTDRSRRKRTKTRMKKSERVGKSKPKKAPSKLIMWPVGLMVGLLAMLAARVLAFHFVVEGTLFGVELPEQMIGLGGQVGLGLVLLYLLVNLVGLRGSAILAGVAGFAVMVLYEPNLMAFYPEVFAQIYSPAHVSTTLAQL